MDDDDVFPKIRRNAIVYGIIFSLVLVGGFELDEFKIAGVKFLLQKWHIYTALSLIWIYTGVRYYQSFMELEYDKEYNSRILGMINEKAHKKATEQYLRANPARYVRNCELMNSERDWIFNVVNSSSKDERDSAGAYVSKRDEVIVSIDDIKFFSAQAIRWQRINTRYVTEYWFPFVMIGLPVPLFILRATLPHM